MYIEYMRSAMDARACMRMYRGGAIHNYKACSTLEERGGASPRRHEEGGSRVQRSVSAMEVSASAGVVVS